MKKILILSLLFSINSFAITKEECRAYYIQLINTNAELNSKTGSEQVEFFLHPEMNLNKYKTLSKDAKLSNCTQKK
jgi:flagella basal body P-ring formation protein FlgA